MKYLPFLFIFSISLKSQVTEEFVLKQLDSLIELRGQDANKSLPIAERAYRNAKILGNNELIGKVANDYGIIFLIERDFNNAVKIFRESIPIAEFEQRLKLQSNLSSVYCDLGMVDSAFFYSEQVIKDIRTTGDTINLVRPTLTMVRLLKQTGNYPEALERLLSIKELIPQTKNYSLITNYNNIVGTTLTNLKDYGSAAKQFKNNIKFIESIQDDKYQQKQGLQDKAQALSCLGVVNAFQKKFNDALIYYNQALEIQKELNLVHSIGITSFNMAEAYVEKGNLVKAELYAIESYNIYQDVNDKDGKLVSNTLLGTIYSQRKMFEKANQKFSISEKIALELENPSRLAVVYDNWSESLENQQNYQKSLEYYKKKTELNDSLFNREKQQRIDVLKTQYDTYKKNVEIEKKDLLLEKKDRQIKYGFGLSAIAFIISGLLGLLLYLFRDRSKKEQITDQILNDNFVHFEESNPHLVAQEVVTPKPVQEIQQETTTTLATKSVAKEYMILTNKRREKLYFKDILHISTEGGQGSAFYHCVDIDKPYYDNQAIKKLAETLASFGFIRIHRQHIVNYKHIISNTSTKAVLSDNSTLPIGRGYKENLRLYVRSLEN